MSWPWAPPGYGLGAPQTPYGGAPLLLPPHNFPPQAFGAPPMYGVPVAPVRYAGAPAGAMYGAVVDSGYGGTGHMEGGYFPARQSGHVNLEGRRHVGGSDNRGELAGAGDGGIAKGAQKNSQAVERELATAREVLARLGRLLPGDSENEIAAYVAERKRNWPRASRQKKTGDALVQIAADYADDSSDNGSVRPGECGRRRGGKAGERSHVAKHLKRRQRGRPSLLAEMLRKDVKRERQTLLLAFEHLLKAGES